jgi:hypothetical protein
MNPAAMRLAIRVFVNGVKQSEERLDAPMDKLDQVLPQLAEKHADMMALAPGMVEIEFLDEPDFEKRFFRMGTDKRSMREPMAIDLAADPDATLSKWKGL